MRIIKFRGKKPSNGDWVYGSLVSSKDIDPAIYFQTGNGMVKTMDWVYVKGDTVGQFTSLYDKNGKAVYTKTADNKIKVGSRVKVRSSAKDYNGNSLAAFVYKSIYTVMEISGNRAVIGVNGAVTAAVHINNLIKV